MKTIVKVCSVESIDDDYEKFTFKDCPIELLISRKFQPKAFASLMNTLKFDEHIDLEKLDITQSITP